MNPVNRQPNKYKAIVVKVVCLVLIFLFLPVQTQAQTDDPIEQVVVTKVDDQNFPEITLFARVLTASGQPVLELGQNAFELRENNREVELQRLLQEDGPIRVHFVIDGGLRMSQAGRWTRTRESIEQFVRDHLLPQDQFAISAIEENRVRQLLSFTQETEQVSDVLDNYQLPCPNWDDQCYSAPLFILNEVLDEFVRAEDSDNYPQFILLFTGELERYDPAEANELTAKATRLNIPIYTVLISGAGVTQRVVNLGINSGGDAHTYQSTSSVSDYYHSITQRLRPHYAFTYRSSDGASDVRTVAVSVDNGQAAGQGSYRIDQVAGPRVSIEQLAESSKDSPLPFDSTQPDIRATVIFTDNYVRQIQQAILTVNGEQVNGLESQPFIEFPFPWEAIRAAIEEDAEEPVPVELAVQVIDEFNLPSAVITRTVWVMPAIVGIIEPVPTEVLSDNGGNGNGTPAPPDPENRTALFTAISIIGLATVMGYLVLTRNKGPVGSVRHTISKQIDRLTMRIVRQSTPRAYLIVLDGDANIGKSLELFGTTTIGRSKQDAELLFQQHDEKSPISRRHCTIMDEEDHFQVRDEDSANGTYLNGVRLDSMVPRELHDGDEIELARVERGGVKLQFQVALANNDYPAEDDYSFEPPRQTKVVRKPQQRGDRF
jgi:hypothetical protein